MAKKDYAALRDAIVAVCGGESNIANASHCMTRLRLQLRDAGKIDQDKAKAIPGVLNLVVQNGEYQFVIGQDVASLYEEFTKLDIKTGGAVEDDAALAEDTAAAKGGVVNAVLSFIGGTFSPVIPVLVAGGLTGACAHAAHHLRRRPGDGWHLSRLLLPQPGDVLLPCPCSSASPPPSA